MLCDEDPFIIGIFTRAGRSDWRGIRTADRTFVVGEIVNPPEQQKIPQIRCNMEVSAFDRPWRTDGLRVVAHKNECFWITKIPCEFIELSDDFAIFAPCICFLVAIA